MSHEAMALVAEQRERLAERARLPWWYWVLFTSATVGLIGGPVFQRVLGTGWSTYAVLWPSLLVYLVADRLARRARGIRLSGRTIRDYPSSLVPGLVFVGVTVAAIITVVSTARHQPDVALWVTVLGTVAAMAAVAWMQRAVRADIRDGRARPT